MPVLKILPDIYSVGVIDWNVRSFHGHTYSTNRGTTYNAYLILDDKTALVDTVFGPFSEELIANIRQVIPVEKIDYIIANHVETDHSGGLPALMKLCPRAKVLGTAKCKEGLYRNYYGNWDFQVVKTGDKLSLGKKALNFIEAPMIHWPDSMFTYCPQEELLMPNDAFGQHYATSIRFDDEADPCELMDEAAKYYANILLPLGAVILKKIEEIQKMNIPIKMIAPSHGIIWRKDPMKIINAYLSWAKNETKPKAVVMYETMWGATEKMAGKIAQGIMDSGINVKIFNIAVTDRTQMVKEMLDAKGLIFGSSTHDNGMLPNIAGFLQFVKGLTPKNRIGCAFGSHGWAGGAVKEIEGVLREAGINLTREGLLVKYAPDEDELKRCYEYGRDFAQKISSSVI
ncbi:MAG: flavodoxin domain-containing protein [Candidatus Omnitrophica bacterium]|nr:flavodoxin domain-containing protein [Candidatus Omnitrophota bacterium]MDD5552267.1 flavodoxin domain-containing protein [Candidatus Omnitrophota bacterium]